MRSKGVADEKITEVAMEAFDRFTNGVLYQFDVTPHFPELKCGTGNRKENVSHQFCTVLNLLFILPSTLGFSFQRITKYGSLEVRLVEENDIFFSIPCLKNL